MQVWGAGFFFGIFVFRRTSRAGSNPSTQLVFQLATCFWNGTQGIKSCATSRNVGERPLLSAHPNATFTSITSRDMERASTKLRIGAFHGKYHGTWHWHSFRTSLLFLSYSTSPGLARSHEMSNSFYKTNMHKHSSWLPGYLQFWHLPVGSPVTYPSFQLMSQTFPVRPTWDAMMAESKSEIRIWRCNFNLEAWGRSTNPRMFFFPWSSAQVNFGKYFGTIWLWQQHCS